MFMNLTIYSTKVQTILQEQVRKKSAAYSSLQYLSNFVSLKYKLDNWNCVNILTIPRHVRACKEWWGREFSLKYLPKKTQIILRILKPKLFRTLTKKGRVERKWKWKLIFSFLFFCHGQVCFPIFFLVRPYEPVKLSWVKYFYNLGFKLLGQ